MTEIADKDVSTAPKARATSDRGRLVRRWVLFVLIGLGLYGALYAWSEALVYQHGEKNRFFMVATAPTETYDAAILGASHAMPLGYQGMNAVLEDRTGAEVINLSMEGAGILPSRLVLDYFYANHSAHNVIFILDSFAFYSADWNEDRLAADMFHRAPLDPALVATLFRYDWARPQLLPYASGFTKINNSDRFAPDLPDAELNKFTTTYRPIPQIDRQRIGYLFPEVIEPAVFERYLSAFRDLIAMVRDHGGEMIVVKPPTPERYRTELPDEQAFDAAIAQIVDETGVEYRDFSTLVPEEEHYYDTDHLNSSGVEAFFDRAFVDLVSGLIEADGGTQ